MPRRTTPPEAVTTWRAIGALRMDRHHLTTRLPRERLLDVVREHVAIQAQVMSFAELTLNARLDDLRPDDIRDALWSERTLVKTWAMRGTLHLIAADELPELVGALADRETWRSPVWLRAFDVTEAQMERLLDAFDEVLTATPMTKAQVADAIATKLGDPAFADRMRSGWGTFLKPAAMRGYLAYGPDAGRNVTYIDPRRWLRVTVPPVDDRALADVVVRFLRVMPAASLDELRRWWGAATSTMRRIMPLIEDRVAPVDVDGQRGFVRREDLAIVARATERGGPLRLASGFDPFVLSITRTAEPLLPLARRPLISRTAGWITPALLAGGAIVGTWSHVARGGRLTIDVVPWRTLSAAELRELRTEADRVGRFLDLPVDLVVAPVLPD